ncbi:MAG: hypothetical protein ACR2NX_15745 [Chthoniobacterales bacterium]
MKREDDQELWDLLGKAGRAESSPFFARNVLRSIREERGWRDKLAPWLSWRRLTPLTGVAVAVLASALAFHSPVRPPASTDNPPEVVAQLDPADYEVVADLDDLLAMQEDNSWSDSDNSRL